MAVGQLQQALDIVWLETLRWVVGYSFKGMACQNPSSRTHLGLKFIRRASNDLTANNLWTQDMR